MAPRGVTRQRILEAARTLFRRQGYHATGLNQVLDEGAAPKGSLYFHFPGGKEQLAVEAVRLSATELRGAVDLLIQTTPDTAAALRASADLLGGLLEHSGFRDGCPISTVALEAAAGSDAIREACAEGYQSWIDLIAERLRADGADEAAAAELATFAVSAIEGALLLARVQRDTTPLRCVAARIATMIEETTA
ncbi:TetR/AcrR family transcriptional regulator [Allokutzneria albata]|uniref:Transcriptional regulator, TetR family n=1 Tax=Allokutzneria albata TaxID=211114 RepID=A0A1G9WB95_ALLAB|nr:TetR/AcrR family transcriptional regulator [Allokutzneria albata]SDM81739.1 transcriptional regulator, TetR family [Allokutzneria albata]